MAFYIKSIPVRLYKTFKTSLQPPFRMGTIQLSPSLHRSLVLMGKFTSKLTVSRSTICSESIQIELTEFCDCDFTIRTKDLLEMLKHTQSFVISGKELKYSYEIGTGSSLIKVEKISKVYDDVYQIAGGIPLLNIVVDNFKLLSEDDYEIRASKNGTFITQSFGIVETRTEYTGLRVVESTVDSIHVKVRAKDLRILEKLGGDIIFSFMESHILAYSLANDSTVIVQIKILNT